MKRSRRLIIFLMLIFFVALNCFDKSGEVQQADAQQKGIATITNVDDALKYYINKFTPPPYPKRGATVNSQDRIIMEKNVTNDDLKYLVFFTELKKLYITKSKRVTDEGLKYIENLSNLNFLNLGYTNITIKGIQRLTKLKNVEYLSLFGTNITDDDLSIIVNAFPGVRMLELGDNKIKGPGVQYLKQLNGTIAEVELGGTLISDDTVKYFAGLEGVEIDLRQTKVTEKGKREILRITKRCSVSIKDGDMAPHE